MEIIESKKNGLTWEVINQELRRVGKKTKTYFQVKCSQCGYQTTGQRGNIRSLVRCPGCADKPAALKTDSVGNCIALCEIGTVEFIRGYQEEHQVSERAAVRQFIETVKANHPAGDPVAEGLTGDKVRAKIRRDTGKVKGPMLGQSDPKINNPSKPTKEKPQRYSVAADPEAVQRFLDKDLSVCQLTKKTALSGLSVQIAAEI